MPATTSRPAPAPVSVDQLRSNPTARRLIAKLGLDGPNGQLSAFLSSRNRSAGDRREWPVDTLPGVVRYLAEMEEAVRLNRRVDQAFTYKGKTWLPAPLLEKGQQAQEGQDKTVLLDWHNDGCIWDGGKKLEAFKNRKVLAIRERADGAKWFRWTWFYSKKQWDRIYAAREAGTVPGATSAAAKPARPVQTPDPDSAGLADAMRITGATHTSLLRWVEEGHPALGGKRGRYTKLRRHEVRIARSNGNSLDVERYEKPQLEEIAAWRKKADDPASADHHVRERGKDDKGQDIEIVWYRTAYVVATYGWTAETLSKWLAWCPALGRAIRAKSAAPVTPWGKKDWAYHFEDIHELDQIWRRTEEEAHTYSDDQKRPWLSLLLARKRYDHIPYSVFRKERGKALAVRQEVLPFHPARRGGNGKPQVVYLEADLRRLNAKLAGLPEPVDPPATPPASADPETKPAEGTNGNGQGMAAAAPNPVKEQVSKRGPGKPGLPDPEREERHRVRMGYFKWKEGPGKGVRRQPKEVYEELMQFKPGTVATACGSYRTDKGRGKLTTK